MKIIGIALVALGCLKIAAGLAALALRRERAEELAAGVGRKVRALLMRRKNR